MPWPKQLGNDWNVGARGMDNGQPSQIADEELLDSHFSDGKLDSLQQVRVALNRCDVWQIWIRTIQFKPRQRTDALLTFSLTTVAESD